MLTLWRPQTELALLRPDVDEQFNGRWAGHAIHSYSPSVDMEETEDGFILRADLPGLNEKDIDIRVDGDELVFSGSREASHAEKGNGSRIQERRFGKFIRKFRLGPHVKRDGIEASYTRGVLTISLPKSDDAKPRQIPVTVH